MKGNPPDFSDVESVLSNLPDEKDQDAGDGKDDDSDLFGLPRKRGSLTTAKRAFRKLTDPNDEPYSLAKKALRKLTDPEPEREPPKLETHQSHFSHTSVPSALSGVFDSPSSPRSPRNNFALENQIKQMNETLLWAIQNNDWSTFVSLTDPNVTSFKPESKGTLLHGLDIHQLEVNRRDTSWENAVNMEVRVLSPTSAICTCERIISRRFETMKLEETRIWQLTSNGWKHVHVHQSQHAHKSSDAIIE